MLQWGPNPGAALMALGSGVVDAAANIFYVLAIRQGLFSLAVVITSLYPAMTVLLARVVLGERIRGCSGPARARRARRRPCHRVRRRHVMAVIPARRREPVMRSCIWCDASRAAASWREVRMGEPRRARGRNRGSRAVTRERPRTRRGAAAVPGTYLRGNASPAAEHRAGRRVRTARWARSQAIITPHRSRKKDKQMPEMSAYGDGVPSWIDLSSPTWKRPRRSTRRCSAGRRKPLQCRGRGLHLVHPAGQAGRGVGSGDVAGPATRVD